MLVILPPVRHAALRAFWLTGTFLAGVVTGVLVACVRDLQQALAAGFVATVLAAAPGLVWPEAVRPAYRAWNHLARVYARIGRLARWGSRSRHSWWLVLLPVLVLLGAVESEQPAGPAADLYTLF